VDPSALFVLAGAIFGLATVIWLPRSIVPNSSSSKYEEILRVATSRNTVRATIAQVVAGLAFVATFIQSSHNFDRDYRQRFEQSTADLFAKTIPNLSADSTNPWSTIGSFYALGAIAKSDERFRRPVYEALAQYILTTGNAGCEAYSSDSREVVNAVFNRLPAISTATRVFIDRDNRVDDLYRMFNLAKSCLVKGDFLNSGGLSHVYLYQARLDGADVRYAFVDRSNLVEVRARAADFQSTSFDKTTLVGAILTRSNFTDATFPSANLQGAYLQGANLTGASFPNANLAWADLRGTVGLTLKQLQQACLEDLSKTPDAQPSKIDIYLDEQLGAQLSKAGGLGRCRKPSIMSYFRIN
jgi:hypothetical protein